MTAAQTTQNQKERRDHVEDYALAGLSFFGLLPCPIKVPFEDRFTRFARQYYETRKVPLRYVIEANSNHHYSFANFLRTVERAEELPDLMMVPGYNTFFQRRFREKFVLSGVFADPLQYEPVLLQNGVRDPAGHYTLLAMNTLVIAVNEAAAPFVPESWGDVLDARMEKQVSIRGDNEMFCDAMLTYFEKMWGEDGLRRLARSVKEGLHPAQMVKNLASPRAEHPSVYVMPYFYAHMLQRPGVRVVWPKEGALLNPIFLMAKKELSAQSRAILGFLTGSQTAAAFHCAGFFSTAAGADATLPAQETFNWIGWDYLYANDMGEKVSRLNEVFKQAYGG